MMKLQGVLCVARFAGKGDGGVMVGFRSTVTVMTCSGWNVASFLPLKAGS